MRIGVDIGGTFTDAVGLDESGRFYVAKSPSTPEDPSKGVLDAVSLLGVQMGRSLADLLAETKLFVHGTTIATNCLLERKGALLGMITTRGFRDLLELRQGTKRNRYELRTPFPQPLIPRPLRREVPERVRFDGTVEVALDTEAVRAELKELRAFGVEGVVVGFLHAQRRGDHEDRVRELADEMGWSPYFSLSHEVLCLEGEYDRLSTTAVNAYVGPVLRNYLKRLEERLVDAGAKVPILVMQSTGGVLPVNEAIRFAVGAIASGPAGGAMAGSLYARHLGGRPMVTYDMGGTSTDICVIQDAVPLERQKTEISDVKIAVPALDINVLGAGGGSIAWIDQGGILDLGPHSAGAVPGPACYGRGGTLPTLTDANLMLGYIAKDTFLDGRLSLSRETAAKVIKKKIAEPLGISVDEASLAIHSLASARIAAGIRAATVRRGFDPRDFALFAFGGAGGLHADAVARELLIPQAIVPKEASVLSALGFLSADVRHDFHSTVGRPIPDIVGDVLRQKFAELEEQGRRALRREGFSDDRIQVLMSADCRYLRQVSSVRVVIDECELSRDDPDWLVGKFEDAYRALYHHVHKAEVRVMETCRVTALGRLPDFKLPRQATEGAGPQPALRGRRRAFFSEWIETPVYWFADLRHGMRLSGPALVDSSTTSVVLPLGSDAIIDAFGSFCIEPAGTKSSSRG